MGIDSSDAYLRLRKDNLAIPKEFYQNEANSKEDSFEFDDSSTHGYRSRKRHPLVPPLNLPRNAVDDWRQKLKIEK